MHLSRSWRRGLKFTALLALAVVAIRAGWRFPWGDMWGALLSASPALLVVALLVNLLSLSAKSWAWHLLLRPVAPHRLRVAVAATVIGSAVNNVSVSFVGELARVRSLVGRSGVPVGATVASLVWVRTAELVAFVLFLLILPSFFPLSTVLQAIQVGAGIALLVGLLVVRFGAWLGLGTRLPARWRSRVAEFAAVGTKRPMAGALALSLANWFVLWATVHLTLRAMHIDVSGEASLSALVLIDLAGVWRLTPANVGVVQGAVVVGLLPFGVSPERAVAAGVVLQAIQVIPVLVMGSALVGWRGLRTLGRRWGDDASLGTLASNALSEAESG